MIHDQKCFDAQMAYSSGEATRIHAFTPLVRKLAWHLSGSAGNAMDVDDLMQIGMIALTQCSRRHDRPSEDGFAAYAKMRIRGEMIDAIRKAHMGARSATQARKQIEAAHKSLTLSLGREPEELELADFMGITANVLAQMRDRSAPIQHSELSEVYDDSNTAFASEEPDAEMLVIESQDRAQLAEAISGLPERLQMVIQLYFLEELNLAEIAEVLDVSVPRVHQLKANALGALRDAMT